MLRSQKANPFYLNNVIYILNPSYIFWEGLKLTSMLI